MPKCKNDETRFFKGTEPSPKGKGYCAHAEKIGTKKKGTDGNKWIVKKTKNGIKRWYKINNKKGGSNNGIVRNMNGKIFIPRTASGNLDLKELRRLKNMGIESLELQNINSPNSWYEYSVINDIFNNNKVPQEQQPTYNLSENIVQEQRRYPMQTSQQKKLYNEYGPYYVNLEHKFNDGTTLTLDTAFRSKASRKRLIKSHPGVHRDMKKVIDLEPQTNVNSNGKLKMIIKAINKESANAFYKDGLEHINQMIKNAGKKRRNNGNNGSATV